MRLVDSDLAERGAMADPDPDDALAGLDRMFPGLGLLAPIYGILKGHADPARGVESLFDRRSEFLAPMRVEHAQVQAATLDRHGDAFDALEFAILPLPVIVQAHAAKSASIAE